MELAMDFELLRRSLRDNETMSTKEMGLMIGLSSCLHIEDNSMGVVLNSHVFMLNQVEQPKDHRWDTMVPKKTKKQWRAWKEKRSKVASGPT